MAHYHVLRVHIGSTVGPGVPGVQQSNQVAEFSILAPVWIVEWQITLDNEYARVAGGSNLLDDQRLLVPVLDRKVRRLHVKHVVDHAHFHS